MFVVVLLSSCDSKEAPAQAEYQSTNLSYSSTRVTGTLCEGVTVDAEIPDLSVMHGYDIVLAHLQLPDDCVIQSMKDYVFADYTPNEIRSEHLEGQHINYFTDDMYEGPWLTTIDDSAFTRVSFRNAKALQDGNGYIDISRSQEVYPLWKEVFSKKQLEFMPQKDAVFAVKSLLSEWGIEPIGEPEVYCLDFEGLRNIGHSKHSTLNSELGNTLDCYLMMFDVGYRNIPYSFYGFESKGIETETYGAKLNVYFTNKGIINFVYAFANYIIDDVVESYDSIISLDHAMYNVKEKYENLVITSEIHISKVYLQYIPTIDGISAGQKEGTGESILVPAWVIQPSTVLPDGECYLDPVFVNAITGQEIV